MQLVDRNITWSMTRASQYSLCPPGISESSVVQHCLSFNLPNHDKVKAMNFVLCTLNLACPRKFTLAKVLKIIYVSSTDSRGAYFLLQLHELGDFVEPYRYPSVQLRDPDTFKLVRVQVITLPTGYVETS